MRTEYSRNLGDLMNGALNENTLPALFFAYINSFSTDLSEGSALAIGAEAAPASRKNAWRALLKSNPTFCPMHTVARLYT
jgi:hypothetical protein